MKGDDRGGRWVVAQFVLIALTLAAGAFGPDWPSGARTGLAVAGIVTAASGLAVAVWAARALGRSLTPFPKPLPHGLVTGGPFALVRHPIYAGALLLFIGYALYARPAALAVTAVLVLLWAAKIRVEERLLAEAYDGYEDYCRNVPSRLIPFLY